MKTKILLGVVLIAVIVGLGVTFPRGNSVVNQIVGAAAGPERDGPCESVNGVQTCYARSVMRTATTTLCSLKAPASTSTLKFASWIITTGTTTAATIDLGTSTTAYSTTTNLIAATSVASGAQGNAFWTPAGAGTVDSTVSPNVYVNVMTASAGLSGYTYGGACQAVFEVL